MHELALARTIVDQINEVVAREHLEQVSRVVLELGTAAGVDVDALRLGFEVAVRSTALERVVLEIESVPNGRGVQVKALEAQESSDTR